ncbi:MAG: MBL fold metallo-hydrolase [Clostridia bacterium]|nr:MBL fold metallo-hydrolase [Clostridia bacterium]
MPKYSRGGSTKRRPQKVHSKGLIILTAVLIVVIAAVLITLWFVKPELYHKYLGVGEHTWSEPETKAATCSQKGAETKYCLVCGEVAVKEIPTIPHSLNDDGICTACGFDSNVNVSIHFLELGNKFTGDCTLIKYGDTEILIDAGSRQGSAATIKNYVDEYCTDGVLEYVIATHAHQDHIAGFVGNKSGDTRTGILYQYEVETLIQFAGITDKLKNKPTEIYTNYLAAVDYAQSRGTTVYTAKQCWYETDGAKKTYYLDDAQTVSLNILYQRFYDEKTADENDYSVCALLTQELQDVTYNYLFTGDLEEDGESSLVESNSLPQVDLFKGGHHGSYTASTEKLLSVIEPKNVAVCCCSGTTEYTDNPANTFPAQAFINRVARYTANIYCSTLILDYKAGEYTSMNGNIVFYTEAGKLKLRCSNNTVILKETDWFKQNRTWPEYGK